MNDMSHTLVGVMLLALLMVSSSAEWRRMPAFIRMPGMEAQTGTFTVYFPTIRNADDAALLPSPANTGAVHGQA